MYEKVWEYSEKDLSIRFINKWQLSLTCPSVEELIINEKIVSSISKNIWRNSQDSVVSRHEVLHDSKFKKYEIVIVAGSKWPGLFLGCHIYVNEKLVGGDINSKIMHA